MLSALQSSSSIGIFSVSIGSLFHNTFSPSRNPLPIFFQWRKVFDVLVHSCQQEVIDPSSKEDQLYIAHHQNDRDC